MKILEKQSETTKFQKIFIDLMTKKGEETTQKSMKFLWKQLLRSESDQCVSFWTVSFVFSFHVHHKKVMKTFLWHFYKDSMEGSGWNSSDKKFGLIKISEMNSHKI